MCRGDNGKGGECAGVTMVREVSAGVTMVSVQGDNAHLDVTTTSSIITSDK